jgi:pimeloyl-ACP methyl ester carboxylesterase
VSSFFFGNSAQPLFGCHHAPGSVDSGAVVICSSFGSEYSYAHRALRVLAKRLAERGRHALRFDYSGQGDSWGENTEANVERWISDTTVAIEELRAISGHAVVDVVGLRLGALVGTACAKAADVGRLVLWDPVLDGREWVHQLAPGFSVKSLDRMAGPCEFANRVVSPALVRTFLDIRPDSYRDPGVESVLVLQSLSAGGLPTHRLHALGPMDHRVVDDALPWREDSSIWGGLVPSRALSVIVEWLGRE